MYLEFFGLEEQPFQLTPDASFLFLSKPHARAKAYMEYTVWNRDSFALITGEIGSGKTTLIQHLLSTVDESVIVGKIHQTQLDEIEFFQAALLEFGLKPFNASKVELMDMLNTFLLDQHREGRQVILIVDEAQNLGKRVLEELRLITGLETQKQKLLNLILVGQPELKETLDSPGMEQLSQRVRFRFHLRALAQDETKEYIEHRLQVAGNKKDNLFPVTTIPLIHRYTGGVPRLINTLCDTTMISALVANSKTITTDLIEEAIEELQWMPYNERVRNRSDLTPETIPFNKSHMPRLVRLVNGTPIREYRLEEGDITIGRLPGNDIRIRDKTISGHHAKIVTTRGSAYLEDLDSTNGTFVNSGRVSKCMLTHGDIISVARIKLKYLNGQGKQDRTQATGT